MFVRRFALRPRVLSELRPPGGDSFRRCSLTIPGKVWSLAVARPHRTLVRLCPLSQVYGLFEGMLEKLELDDGGE